MLRRKELLFLEIALAADAVTLAASFLFAYWLRRHFDFWGLVPRPDLGYLWAIWIILPAFMTSLALCGLYRSSESWSWGSILTGTVKAVALGALALMGVLYMMKRPDLSRFVLNVFALVSLAALPIERFALDVTLRRTAKWRRKRGGWQVLVVGEREQAEAYLRLLKAHPHWGVVVAGIVSPTHRFTLAAVSAAGGGAGISRSVTAPVDWREVLKAYVVDEIVTVSPWLNAADFLELQEACAERGLIFRMLITMPTPQVGQYSIEDIGNGSYLVSLETVPQDLLALLFKRATDIAGSLVGLVLCGLVYVFYALVLRWESPGPVFFSQKRIGRNGRIFHCKKFRTMYLDAERRQVELLGKSKLGAAFIKIKDDPRVTRTGAWMRRRHLDELPQFWNILKGEMSLVGPRPSQPIEVSNYREPQRRRLSMKPGLTGLFQISGHDAISDFDEVVRLDCDYIDNWSLWLDCRIILKTLVRVLKAGGW